MSPSGLRKKSVASTPTEMVDAIRHRVIVWEACVLLILLGVLTSIGREPWPPDELRYAQVVQAMHGVGDLFVPQLWGTVYTQKPPLFFWLVRAVAPLLGGVSLSAMLVPVVLAACLGVWLTSRIASGWYGRRAGTLSVLVLMSLPLYPLMAQIGRMDMLLTAAITASVHSLYQGYVEDRRWSKVMAFVWMGIGVLAKGPFGVVFPLAVGVIALVFTGTWRRLLCRETVVGLTALLGILAIWIVPAVLIAGSDYLMNLLGRQVLERAVSGLDHREPPYFYFWILPILLLPWVIFFLPAARSVWRHWKARHEAREVWLLCWVAVPLVVLSLVREKLPVYLLPCMPPIAIMIARYWTDLFARRESLGHTSWLVTGLFAFVLVAGTVMLGVGLALSHPTPEAVELGGMIRISTEGDIARQLFAGPTMFVGGAVLLGLGVMGSMGRWFTGDRYLGWTFGTLTAFAPCGMFFLALVLLPLINGGQSWRSVADALASQRKPGESVVTYAMRPYIGFYANERVEWSRRPDQLAELVLRKGMVCCVAEVERIRELERFCVAEYDPAGAVPSPNGPVYIVHLRPLAMADKSINK